MAPAAVPPRGAAAFQGSTAALAASRARGSVRRAARLAATASLTYKEAASGIEFPLVQRLWLGEEMRCVGAGCRSKKIAFIGVKVYAAALYVEAEKMARELGGVLAPRMRLMGDTKSLDAFKSFFLDKKLAKDTNVVLMYRTDGSLDVALRPGRVDWSTIVADLSVASPGLCRGLFEIYLGSESVVPDARKEWAAGARKLLDSDDIRRQTRKGGSG
ncbi:hypothetical protein COHA_007452 [Chlorella ohadii]|uniref:Chalcone-flavonone isomerase family protein n=1 Tax=Chlorella ohadii TaxID=2649997 RepID=A0AAD5DM66_9CHLO|nr:hypothetical protein COHA_007452 [Chlorella ohadii]